MITQRLQTFRRSNFQQIFLLCIFLSPFAIPIILSPRGQLYSDHLAKYVVGQSIVKNQYKSEELRLPSYDLLGDKDYCSIKCLYLNERLVSPFPAALGYFYALFLPWSGIDGVFFGVAILLSISLHFFHRISDGNWLSMLILAFASPFLINGIFFPDLGIASFLFLLGFFMFFLKGREKWTYWKDFGSGWIAASAGWFRIEAIGLPLCFAVLAISFYCKNGKESRETLSFILGVLLGIGCLFGLQWYLYGYPLGPRFLWNEKMITDQIWDKWKTYFGLLFYSYGRKGFFTYMPFFLLILPSIFVLTFQKLRQASDTREERIRNLFVLTGVTAFVGIVILSPNDGVIDYGSRYLSLTIPAFALGTVRVARKVATQRKRLFFWILGIFMIYSMTISITYLFKLQKFSSNTEELDGILKDENPDLVVLQFTGPYTRLLGAEYMSVPSVVLRNDSEMQDFFGKYSPNSFQKILFQTVLLPSERSGDLWKNNQYYLGVQEILGDEFIVSSYLRKYDALIFSFVQQR